MEVAEIDEAFDAINPKNTRKTARWSIATCNR